MAVCVCTINTMNIRIKHCGCTEHRTPMMSFGQEKKYKKNTYLIINNINKNIKNLKNTIILDYSILLAR